MLCGSSGPSCSEAAGEQGRTPLALAFHSKALSKVPPKEVSAFSSLLSPGDSHSGESYWNLTCFPKGPQVAKDPKGALSLEQCRRPPWNSRQTLPPSFKHEEMMGEREGREPFPGSGAAMYPASILRGCADALSPHPPWVMPAPWGPQLCLRLPACLLVQL